MDGNQRVDGLLLDMLRWLWEAAANPLSLMTSRRNKKCRKLVKTVREMLRVKEVLADLPDFQQRRSNVSDDAETERMGTIVWPRNEPKAGKGRDRSTSISPRSEEYVRHRVKQSRELLKSELAEAFFSLGINQMGEEVSEAWTDEEQNRFGALVRENSAPGSKTFMKAAFEEFPYKGQKSIVSYYYNVFVPKRISIQTRLLKMKMKNRVVKLVK